MEEPSPKLLEPPAWEELSHTTASQPQFHTQHPMEVKSHTHMLPLHQDMKPSPMKPNQPHTVDQSPTLIPLPATVDHHHIPNNHKLPQLPTVELLLILTKSLHTVDPRPSLKKAQPHHMVDK